MKAISLTGLTERLSVGNVVGLKEGVLLWVVGFCVRFGGRAEGLELICILGELLGLCEGVALGIDVDGLCVGVDATSADWIHTTSLFKFPIAAALNTWLFTESLIKSETPEESEEISYVTFSEYRRSVASHETVSLLSLLLTSRVAIACSRMTHLVDISVIIS